MLQFLEVIVIAHNDQLSTNPPLAFWTPGSPSLLNTDFSPIPRTSNSWSAAGGLCSCMRDCFRPFAGALGGNRRR